MEYKGELTSLESRLVECAAAGDELDCAPPGAAAAEFNEIDDWEERNIRADVLVALCTGEVSKRSVHPRRGLRLRGAHVTGQVDLSRAELTLCPLAFHTCRFDEDVLLQQVSASDVSFTSCKLPSLYGEWFNSSASLDLTATELRKMSFDGASLRGDVLLSEVRLINPGGNAFSANDMSATNAFIRDTHVKGEVSLSRADLSGQLSCREGTELINPEGTALDAEACRVGGRFVFGLGEAAVGEVNLSHAQVGTLDDNLASWPESSFPEPESDP